MIEHLVPWKSSSLSADTLYILHYTWINLHVTVRKTEEEISQVPEKRCSCSALFNIFKCFAFTFKLPIALIARHTLLLIISQHKLCYQTNYSHTTCHLFLFHCLLSLFPFWIYHSLLSLAKPTKCENVFSAGTEIRSK